MADGLDEGPARLDATRGGVAGCVAQVGVSPNQWVTQQRVDRARQLLETTDLPVESVAHEAGFGSATLLRQHLRAAIGVSPLSYRHTFRVPEPERAVG